jgi:sigma-B regulation protein RsbU (phosphoserine phosphatase)
MNSLLEQRVGDVESLDQSAYLGSFASVENVLAGDCALILDSLGSIVLRMSRTGEFPSGSADPARFSNAVGLLTGNQAPLATLTLRGQGLWVGTPVPVPEGTPAFVLFVHYPMAGANRLVAVTTLYVAGIASLLTAGAIVLATRLSKYMTQPLRKLNQAAKQIGAGDLAHRVSYDYRDEFGEIATAFNQMASSLQDYMRSVEAEAQRREQLESELRIAAHLQQSLLPTELPTPDGLDFAALSRPARQAGGDFYDICEVGREYIYFAVGDATNKGLPAAVHITECASAIRVLARLGYSPSQVLGLVNAQLYEDLGDSCRFVTMFLARLNLVTRTLTYAVAGHNPPVLLHRALEEPEFLAGDSGLPLGVSDHVEFRDADVQLRSGDVLLLYTDGLTEAADANRELMGSERVVQTLLGARKESASSILNALLNRVEEHSGGIHGDDLTMAVVRIA